MRTNRGLPFSYGLLGTLVCVLLTGALPLGARASSMALLPPPPPPPPPPRVQVVPAVGGFIHLHARFPETWPWVRIHWQEVWTAVEWQDARGTWHKVEGWRGELDGVTAGEGGAVVGQKRWWVAERDLDTGPFRWVVTLGEGGRLLGTSEPFNLPESRGVSVVLEVSLE